MSEAEIVKFDSRREEEKHTEAKQNHLFRPDRGLFHFALIVVIVH